MKMSDYGLINDMPKGWVFRYKHHKVINKMWKGMFYRSYDEEFHKKKPTYKNCEVYDEFKLLSNFVAWIKSEPRYDEFKANPHGWCIDKDMKSPGNKLYYPEYMTLTTRSENTREQVLRCGNSHLLYAKRTYHTKPVIGINNNSVVLLKSISHGKLKGFTPNGICACCNKRQHTHRNYKWFYINYKHNLRLRKFSSTRSSYSFYKM